MSIAADIGELFEPLVGEFSEISANRRRSKIASRGWVSVENTPIVLPSVNPTPPLQNVTISNWFIPS